MELGIGSIVFIYDSIVNGKFKSSIDLLLYSIEKTLNYAEENNIKVCELILDPPEILLSEDKQRFIDLCNSYPSMKKQFHAPYADLSLCTRNPWILGATLDCYTKSSEICKDIRADILTIHPGNAKFLHHSYNGIKNQLIDSVSILANKIKSLNVVPCLENMPKMNGYFLVYKEIEKFFRELKINDVYLAWDTGHSSSCNDNIEKLWENLHQRIRNIHLVDNINGTSDAHPPLGEGKVDFERIFEIIQSYNYQGSMIIELHKLEDLPKSIEYVKQFF